MEVVHNTRNLGNSWFMNLNSGPALCDRKKAPPSRWVNWKKDLVWADPVLCAKLDEFNVDGSCYLFKSCIKGLTYNSTLNPCDRCIL